MLIGLAVGSLHRRFDIRFCPANPWVDSLCVGVTDGWLPAGYQDVGHKNGYDCGKHHDDKVPDT